MLRAPNSKYVEGRSDSLLKLKKLDDAEAEVIDYEIGKGKHAGRIGALVCRAFGKVFRLGSGLSDALRDKPPKIGSMVTFVFNGKTDDGLPRFPVFIGVRDYE